MWKGSRAPVFSVSAVFDHPWLLWAVLPVAAFPLLAPRIRAPAHPSISFPCPATTVIPRTLRQKLMWLPDALRTAAVALLVFAAAGPHWGAMRMTDETRGIAIELVVDRSGSMSLNDLVYKSRRESRLDVVKTIAKEFLLGNGSDLKGRSGDAIGLVSFAAHAQNLSPLVSHDEAMLAGAIDSIEIARGMEDATAIGDAVAVAATRIRSTEEERSVSFRSKIIILLTDGQENAGTRRIGDAARLAARWNIRVYAIGIRPSPEDSGSEDDLGYGLDTLASATKGMSVTARDAPGLQRFFADIDRLEPNEIPVTGLNGGFNATAAALVLACSMICAEMALRQTSLRCAP
jgi:Ca-activated chloride channel family protein